MALPTGLSLNEKTGEISGIPTDIMDLTSYTVYAENESGATQAMVSIQVRKGRCMAEGVFPVTLVGETAVYECSTQGSYVGTQKRTCVLGDIDGEWQKASGFCTSVLIIVVIVIAVIVVIGIVVLMLVRMGKRSRPVGGVKGKKSVKTTVSASKKSTKKVAV